MPPKTDKGKAPSAAGDSPTVDPTIWKAVSSISLNIPPAGSSIYYFTNGHADQCSSPLPNFRPSYAFPCHLAAVNLHADPTTDQIFATFTLTADLSSPVTEKAFSGGGSVTSVVKTLTKTETNSKSKSFLMLPESARDVFRYCPPGNDVDVYDLNNRRWTFRLVLRGSPPLHLLTNGWGHFVSSKMLVAGDKVVFVRDHDGIIIVGFRRCDDDESGMFVVNTESSNRLIRKKGEEAEMVLNAIRWVEADGEGMVEGSYYPDRKLPLYVVKKEVVEEAMRVEWKRGMRVFKRWEFSEGLIYWVFGTVTDFSSLSTITPWRMLDVIWDDTGGTSYENPWEVKPVAIRALMSKEEI